MHTNAARQFLEEEIPVNSRDHVPITFDGTCTSILLTFEVHRLNRVTDRQAEQNFNTWIAQEKLFSLKIWMVAPQRNPHFVREYCLSFLPSLLV